MMNRQLISSLLNPSAKVHPSHSIFLPLHFSVSIYFISSADRRCRNNRRKKFLKICPMPRNQSDKCLAVFSDCLFFISTADTVVYI